MTTAIVLVLASAVMHAGWNLLVKVSGDKLIMMWAMHSGALVLTVPIVVLHPPTAAALPYIAVSGLVHMLYNLALVRAYRLGEYSLVYTFARGLSPALSATVALLALGERLSAVAVGGLFTTVAGLLLVTGSLPSLAHDGRHAIPWSVVTALLIASYTVLDAAGVRTAGQAVSYVSAVFIVNHICLTPITLWRRWGHQGWARLRREWRGPVVAAPLQMTSYMLVVAALEISSVGYITSLRETGVVFAALFGWRFLNEPYGRVRIAGTCAVVAGIVGLTVGGGA